MIFFNVSEPHSLPKCSISYLFAILKLATGVSRIKYAQYFVELFVILSNLIGFVQSIYPYLSGLLQWQMGQSLDCLSTNEENQISDFIYLPQKYKHTGNNPKLNL